MSDDTVLEICKLCIGCPDEWIPTGSSALGKKGNPEIWKENGTYHLMGMCKLRNTHVHEGSDYYEGRVLCPDFFATEEGREKLMGLAGLVVRISTQMLRRIGQHG